MRLTLTVSLDDASAQEWIEGFNVPVTTPGIAFRYVAARCKIVANGSIINPNGNTIGNVEVVE